MMNKLALLPACIVILCSLTLTAWAIAPDPAEFATSTAWIQSHFSNTAVSLPFSFTYDGKSSNDFIHNWKKEYFSRKLEANRILHTLTFADPATGLVVSAKATVYTDFPAVEWVLNFKNTSKKDTPILENILPLDLQQPVVAKNPLLYYSKGALCCLEDFAPVEKILSLNTDVRLSPGGGRSSSEVLPFFNLDLDSMGMVLGIGWTGEWQMVFRRTDEKSLQLQSGLALTHLKLFAGEEIRTPSILLLFWHGSTTQASEVRRLRGNNLLRRFILAHHRPHPGGVPLTLPVIQGAWGSWPESRHMQIIQKLIDLEMDVNLYWIDADWFGQGNWWFQAGDWRVKKQFYPNGFKPISNLLHRSGMEFLLWFELFRVCKTTPWHQFSNNTGWLLQLTDGVEEYQQWRSGTKWPVPHEDPKWIVYESHRSQMTEDERLFNLGNEKARRFLTDFLSAKITEFGLDWYREDANIAPVEYWRCADALDRQGITETRYIEGLYAFWDELLRKFPKLKIDNCASGGRRIDLETIGRSTVLHRTDWAYDAIHAQCHSFGLFQWLPLHMAGRAATLTKGNEYEIRSAMTAGLVINLWDEKEGDQSQEAKKQLQQYRSVQKFFLGDYYPLTAYSQKNTDWLAWQFNLPEESAGMVQIFRREKSVYESAGLKLFGLEPDQKYMVENLDSGEQKIFMGNDLLQKGLVATITNQPGSALLKYTQIE